MKISYKNGQTIFLYDKQLQKSQMATMVELVTFNQQKREWERH